MKTDKDDRWRVAKKDGDVILLSTANVNLALSPLMAQELAGALLEEAGVDVVLLRMEALGVRIANSLDQLAQSVDLIRELTRLNTRF